MKMKRLLCAVMSAVVMIVGLCVPTFAEDGQKIDLSKYGYNFSFEIPAAFAPNANNGDSLDKAGHFYSMTEGENDFTFNVGLDTITSSQEEIDSNSEAFINQVFNVFADYIFENFKFSITTIEVGDIFKTAEGTPCFHLVTNASDSKDTFYIDAYLFVVGDKVIRLATSSIGAKDGASPQARVSEIAKGINSSVVNKLAEGVTAPADSDAPAVPAASDGNQRIDLSPYGLNYSFEIPSTYVPDSKHENKGLDGDGLLYTSADGDSKPVPFFTVSAALEDLTSSQEDIDNFGDAFVNELLNHFAEYILNGYGVSITSVDRLEGVTIDGTTYLHATMKVEFDDITCYFDAFYLPIGNKLLRISAVGSATPDDTTCEELTSNLSYGAINSLVKAGESAAPSSQDTPQNSTEEPEKNFFEQFISFEFPTWIFLAALAILLIAGAKVSKRGEWQPEPLSLGSSKCIQGFCAVAIILHHMSQGVRNAGELSVLQDAGVLFVGIFFFFSGFGLLKSLRTKENYLKGFLKKRLPTILVPFFVCILVFLLVASLLGEQFSIPDLFGYISGWFLINSHMWYIVEIAILYLAFFLIFKLIKNDKIAITVMGGFIVALIVGSLLTGHGRNWFQGEWWFNSTLLFFIGILVSRFEAPLAKFAKKFYAILLPLLVVGFGFMFALNLKTLADYSYYRDNTSSFITLGVQLPTIIIFVLAVLLIMMKVKFSNRVLTFLGTISLELYLIHNLFIQYLRTPSVMNVTSDSMYIALVIIGAVILATIISGLDKYIIGLFTKKNRPSLLAANDKKIHSINVMKLFAAFLVVAIHVPFSDGGARGITIAFGKVAVPFFLVVCGYFLYRNDNLEFMKRLKKQALKIFILTAAANVFFMLFELVRKLIDGAPVDNFFGEYFSGNAIANFFLWNMSPFGDHLWYLGSLLYALLFMMLLCKTKTFKYAMFAAPALLAGYIILSFTLSPENYFMYRNSILCTLPYLMFGCMISRFKDKLMKTKVWWYIGAGVILCALTVIEYNLRSGDLSAPYFSIELLVYVLVLIALKLPNLGAGTLADKLGSKCTLFIYIVHIAVAEIIMSIAGDCVPAFFRTLAPIVIFVSTLLLALAWNFLKSLLPKRNKNSSLPQSEEPEKIEQTV